MDKLYFWSVFVLYATFMAGIGFYIYRKQLGHTREEGIFEFWMAKRQMPGLWLGMSLTAGWLMLGWIGFGMSQIYLLGATALWILPLPWFILTFLIVWMVPHVRRLPSMSIPEAIEKRYGKAARTLLALFSAYVFISWTQAELFMTGTLMSPFLGVEPWLCMTVLVVPIIIYIYLGGFRAVVTTDAIQFVIAAVFMAVLAVAALSSARSASHGDILGALRQITPPLAAKGEMFHLFFLGFLFPLVLLIGYLPGWLIEQDLILRLQGAKSTKEARRGAWAGLVLIITFVIALPTLVAFCALVAFPPGDGAAAAAVGANAYSIISAFIAQMPLGLAVFMLMGIIATQMSTIDTFVNVAAMHVSYDLIDPLLLKNAPEKTKLRAGRLVSVAVILVGLGLAFISESLGDIYYVSSGVLSASIAVPLFFIFWKRTTHAAVLVAATAGFLGTVGGYWFEYKFLNAVDPTAPTYYMTVLPAWLQGSFCYNYLAFGVLLSLVAILAVSLLTKQEPASKLSFVKAEPLDGIDEFKNSMFAERTL